MKSNRSFQDAPLAADERLIDALLREHARAGTAADEALLTRLDAALAADAAGGAPSAAENIVVAPQTAARCRNRAFAWSLGLAAGLALAAGIVWKLQTPRHSPQTTAAEAPVRGRSPLTSGIPAELIEGTPKPMNVPGLVPVPGKAPTLLVPEGTVLLSKGKPVTGSDQNPIIGDLSLITDGDKDAGEGYFVELIEGLQWVQVDLGQSAAVQAVWVWHFHSQRRAYHDVIVQISDDPQFKQGVTTVFNNDYDDSAKLGLGKGKDRPYVESRFGLLVDAKGTRGRYVRLYSAGNTSNESNHYIEVEVFGIPG